MTADTFTEGQTVTVMAAPGYPTETRGTVAGVTPRLVTVQQSDGRVEVFTLRRNGKFALAGERQWSLYLRAVRA